jgi:hypothetical protein
VAALLGGYLYVCVADVRSPLERIARQELRDLKRQGVAIDQVQLVHFLFQAPTPEVAYQLRGRLQALSLDAKVSNPSGEERAAAAAELTEAGLEVPDPSGTAHEVEAQRRFIPTRAALRRYRKECEALAREVGAEYAGWYIV